MHMRLSMVLPGAIMMIAGALSAQQYPAPPYGPSQQIQFPPQQQANQQDTAAMSAPDEPGRPVARLSVLSGDASVRRGDSGDWVAAVLNAPLMAADSVSVAAGGAVELQLDRANFVRLAGDSEVRISNLDPGHYQIQLAKGLVTWRVLRDAAGQPEISTPLVAVHPGRDASVRVEVAPDGSTRVTVRRGDADVFTPKGSEHVHQGNMMTVRGAPDDPEYQVINAPAPDQWDSWSDQRDAYLLRAQSPRYVSPDVTGTEDLDAYGRWGYDPAYGNVWTPAVPPNWAPYQDGQWVWEDYYGWTWVDYDPWGWAPFHYGSWYFRTGFGWSWFPGARFGHFWWHPALVGFVGFGPAIGFGFGFGNIGWIALAPFELFHPWYGRGGFAGGGVGLNVNIVRNASITAAYRNARFAGGVNAVSAADFQRGSFGNRVGVNGASLQGGSLIRGAVPVTPSAANLRFSNRGATLAAPRADLGSQRFFSRAPASPAGSTQRTPFTQQQAAVRSAFESRGIRVGASSAGFTGTPNSGSGAPAVARSSATPGWERFGSPQTGGGASQYAGGVARGYSSGPSRSVQVAPPIVHQQYSQPSYNRGNSGFGAPSYRPAPSAHPSYRSSPEYRSAPAPAPRGGGGGGGHASGGGHGGHR
ncbi:MAG: DUF6600 domain-containing protein [Bryobacteraceae bacterium]|jgi:hypothetical protein